MKLPAMASRGGGWEMPRAGTMQRSRHKNLERPQSGSAAGLGRSPGPGAAGQSTWGQKGPDKSFLQENLKVFPG